MKIAVLINKDGNTLPFSKPGVIRLYDFDKNDCRCIRQIKFNPSGDMNISRIRLYIHELSSRLDGCKALVMRKSPGIFNAILEEELGIRIWTVNGQPFDAFPHIKAQTETAMDTAQGCASCRGTGETAEMAATPVGDLNDGLFQINLVEIQQKNSSLNSREILLPFLEQKKDFTELEIICLHIPKWLNEEMLEKLNIELTSGKRKDGFTHAFIYRLNRDE